MFEQNVSVSFAGANPHALSIFAISHVVHSTESRFVFVFISWSTDVTYYDKFRTAVASRLPKLRVKIVGNNNNNRYLLSTVAKRIRQFCVSFSE